MDKSVKNILDILPYDISLYFKDNTVTEIRLRSGCNIILNQNNYTEIYNTPLTQQQIENILLIFCKHSLHAFENSISQGFITLEGGHRVGIGGVYNSVSGKNLLKKVTSLNIRINANKVFDIPDDVLNFKKGLLVTGRPHTGKTTFLKSIIPLLKGCITVCDEREELYIDSSNCDFLSGIQKSSAIHIATRTLNPDYIICDEIGDLNEAKQILSAVNSGVKFICSAHSDSINSLYLKPNINILLSAYIFDKIILLDKDNNKFKIKEIKDV